jgi:Zn-dependent M32 family carboxypeptidase
MLDIAWTVFEIRMLREPNSSPNRVWTDLTSHYLGIVPHPDWAWWALRTQLVDTPGYMANYGAGAILTAAMRERIRQSIGSFDAGNARWYPWVSEHILRYGSELPTEELVARLVGGKISAQALIADIRGVAASDPTCAAADRPRQGQ